MMKMLFDGFNWRFAIAAFMGGAGIVFSITFLFLAVKNDSPAYLVGMLLPVLCFAAAVGVLAGS